MPDQIPDLSTGPAPPAPGRAAPPPGCGPRRSTLAGLAAVCNTDLFIPSGTGWALLAGSKAALAEALGVSPQALNSRLAVLAEAGLAVRDRHRLAVHVDGIHSRLDGLGPASTTARDVEVRRRLSAQFDEAADVGGRVVYLHRDGAPASLRDLAEAVGFSSRGSAAYHMRRQTSGPDATITDIADGRRPRPEPAGDHLKAARAAAAEARQLAGSASGDHAQLLGDLVALVSDTVALVARYVTAAPAVEHQPEPSGDTTAARGLSPRDSSGRPRDGSGTPRDTEPVVSTDEMRMRYTEISSQSHSPRSPRDDTGSRATPNRYSSSPDAAQTPAASVPLIPEAELARVLEPLAEVAAREGMAPINVAVVADAVRGLELFQVQSAVALMCAESDRRPMMNVGGLLVHAARIRDPHYFPSVRAPLPSRGALPVFDPSAYEPQPGDVSAEENVRRSRLLRAELDAVGRPQGVR